MTLPSVKQPKIEYGLALGGGGLSGVYALGVRQALLGHFRLPDPAMIIGSSISTSTACLNTLDQLNHATDIWLNQASSISIVSASIEALKAYYGSVIQMIRGGISTTFIEDEVPPTYFCLTNAQTGEPESVRVDQLDSMEQFYRVMSGSMALPILSDPVGWQEKFYVDGDFSWSTATRSEEIRAMGVNNIIAVECCTETSSLEFLRILKGIKDGNMKSKLRCAIRRALNFSTGSEIIIAPSEDLPTGIFENNSRGAIQFTMQLGYKDTINHPGIQDLAGKYTLNLPLS